MFGIICFAKDYPWQSCDSLHNKKEKTDKRREELLKLMYDNSSCEVEGIKFSISDSVGCNT